MIDIKICPKKARADEAPMVAAYYGHIISEMKEAGVNYTCWEWEDYPTTQVVSALVEQDSMYLCRDDEGRIFATVGLDCVQPSDYDIARWSPVAPGKAMIVHLLSVRPGCSNHGVGRRLLEFAQQKAMEQGCHALRLIVLALNVSAIHLYEKCGFSRVDKIDIGLEKPEYKYFYAYEKLL